MKYADTILWIRENDYFCLIILENEKVYIYPYSYFALLFVPIEA